MSKKIQKKSAAKKAQGNAGEKLPKTMGEGSQDATTAEAKKQGTNIQEAAVPAGTTATKPAKTEPLIPGAKAPSFFLPRDGGQFLSLASFSGRKLVVFFYPRADTPGCTIEAKDFSRLSDEFTRCQTAVIGVSADPVKVQESFRDKHQLTIALVSDETQDMLRKYGAWGEKSMYGKTFEGVLRSTVLTDADGQILQVWRNVKVEGHAEQVLAAAKAL